MRAELLIEFGELAEIVKDIQRIAREIQALRGELYAVRMHLQRDEPCAQLLRAEDDRLLLTAERARTLANRVTDALDAFDECDRRIQRRMQEIACDEVLFEDPKASQNRSSRK